MVVGRLIPLASGALPLRAAVLLGLVVAQRIAELALSRGHIRSLRERAHGTAELRTAGTRFDWCAMIAVHAALVILPALEVVFFGARASERLFWCAVGVYAATQALRYWSIASLGSSWNARAVVDSRRACVSAGPYRWIRHPNYLAVLIEFSAVPLALGAWRSWIVLNVVHAPILWRRIRAEEELLAAIPGYSEEMLSKGRFVPRVGALSLRRRRGPRECP